MEQLAEESKAWVVSKEIRSQHEGAYADQNWYNLSIKKNNDSNGLKLTKSIKTQKFIMIQEKVIISFQASTQYSIKKKLKGKEKSTYPISQINEVTNEKL